MWRAFFALAILLASVSSLAAAQADAGSVTRISADEIRARIDALQSRTDVVASDKQLTLENLQLALARLQSAESARKLAAEYAQSLKQAPEKIAKLQAKLEQPHDPAAEQNQVTPLTMSPAAAQLQMAALQIRLVSLRGQRRELEESLKSMASRKIETRQELADLRSQLEKSAEAVPSDASQMLVDSSQIKDDAVRQDLSARIERDEQEILSLPTRSAIASAQLSVLGRELDQAQVDISMLGRRMDAREQEDLHEKLDRGRKLVADLIDKPEPFQALARQTEALREKMFSIANEVRKLWSTKDRLHGQLEEVSSLRKDTEQILAFGRVGEEYGRLLRGIGNKLSSEATLSRRISKRQETIVDGRVARFGVEQKLAAADTGPTAVNRLIEELGDTAGADSRALAESLLKGRREALKDLIEIRGRQVEALDELNQLETELRERSAQLRLMLDQRLLWLPSAAPVNSQWGAQILTGLAQLGAPENLATMLPAVRESLAAKPIFHGAIAAVIVLLLGMRRRMLGKLDQLAKPIGTRMDRFSLTLSALFVTILLALPVALVFELLSRLLFVPASPSSLPSAFSRGFFNVGVVLLVLGLFRNMCRQRGLFASHFQWDARAVQRLGLALWRLSLTLAPAVWLIGVARASEEPIYAEGIGRLGLLISSVALAIFSHRMFSPRRGTLTKSLEPQGLLWRTRFIWHAVLVLTPLLLAGIAMAGYSVSASELQGRMITSAWVLLLVIIMFQIAMRGVLVAGRRTAYKQAAARRAREREEERERADEENIGEGAPVIHEESEIDVVTVSQQTRGILRAASLVLLVMVLWKIWGGLVPALGIFNDVVLWSSVTATSAGQVVTAVTLGHILLGVLLLVLTIIAARNLPGFLEVVVLHRFNIDAGTRYAYVTITRYVILAFGLVFAFSFIGADWSKLQWIVAALGVGLGFGLQEVVANFVSGIIILFERPVRVGDLITIDDTVGTVTRIKIRAITITDPDNFEVVVPNKAFITKSVKNWSLTNPITRLVVKVGIAYSSDVAQAQQIMLDIAKANEQVLETPSPVVLFLGFGESSLNLELRVFAGSIDHRLSTLHNLHVAIFNAFNEAGIEIPFPQRDVHVHGLLARNSGDGDADDDSSSSPLLPTTG
ncbi:MAG TPA: mechanosensitive ion channel domain-containing protein [Dokdonella sp.]|uniref:mechanosensitive ion channel domain-containing protein n=1 Tax=Dokdonella sp. TaxID=2291710 RepID=UPI002D7F37E8|nr:mechanosensitive ion channel domain-containing protein [Dokdonella sp.]HET9033715.1 mechanosensitive ion channel domain-containing protein [Dokdonella sp.]